jgi:excisionase family DNA binding protein
MITGTDAYVLTVLEVAAELRCSKAHVHNLINGKVRTSPALPALRIGRRRLIRSDTLLRWMQDNEWPSDAPGMIRSSPRGNAVDA